MSSHYAFTSPFLLARTDSAGVHYVTSIFGDDELAETPELLRLLEEFRMGKRLNEARATSAEAKDLLEKMIATGFLVNDIHQHREHVFEQFEARFDPQQPKIGYIETTSKCPFTCVMCPKSSDSYVRPDSQMTHELFVKIAKQLNYQDMVNLHLFGDPLMDTALFSRIEVLWQLGIKASFSTNAPLLSEQMVASILDSPLHRMVISCDAISAATYKAMRGPLARQETAQRKLQNFLDARRHRGSHLKVVLRFVGLDRNASEFEEFCRQWAGYDGIEIDYQTHLRFPDVDPYLDQATRRSRAASFFSQTRGRRAPVKCVRHWFSNHGELGVQVDGTVVACCLSHSQEGALGNLATSTLAEIWSSPQFSKLRRAIFFKVGLDEFPLCQRCNFDMS